MQGSAGFGTVKLNLGDRVRLKEEGPDGAHWRIAAYSYARNTFDLMACNPHAPEQFRNGLSGDDLVIVEPNDERRS